MRKIYVKFPWTINFRRRILRSGRRRQLLDTEDQLGIKLGSAGLEAQAGAVASRVFAQVLVILVIDLKAVT